MNNNLPLTWICPEHKAVLTPSNYQREFLISTPFSYSWFREVCCRRDTIEYLASHDLTEMLDSRNSWPTLDIPKLELIKRLQQFKRNALLLIYQLADCAAGSTDMQHIRKKQGDFLDNLSSSKLASLGCIVEILGQAYFTMTKNALIALGSGASILPTEMAESRRDLYIPTSVP